MGEIEPHYGFTSIKKLPGSRSLYVAIKASEYTEQGVAGGVAGKVVTRTKMSVFDLDGRFYMTGEDGTPWLEVDQDYKYEGLEFL